VTKYNWDGQILRKTKLELEPKLEQKLRQQQNQFFFSENSEGFIQP
jgi:hypothetical protein